MLQHCLSRYTAWYIDPQSGALAAEVTHSFTEEELHEALIAAARAGDAEAVVRCLRDGADPNAADGDGQTALYCAAMRNQVGCLEVLGEAGADLDKAEDGDGWTPLIIAAVHGQTAAVGWLLARGADWRLTDRVGVTALNYAKRRGKAEAAAALEAWIAEHP